MYRGIIIRLLLLILFFCHICFNFNVYAISLTGDSKNKDLEIDVGVYTIYDIRVFKEESNASIAKMNVIQEAKKLAILEFIKNSSSNLYVQSVGIINKMHESDLDYAIKRYKVKWEDIGINSYEAVFDFEFDPTNFAYFIDLFLKKDFKKRKVLVIPVYKEFNDEYRIWENIWFDSWQALKKEKVVVIHENLDALTYVNVSYNNVLYDVEKLKKIYNVNDVFTFYAIEELKGEDIYINIEMRNDSGKSIYKQRYILDQKVNLKVFFREFVRKTYNKIFNDLYVLQFMNKYYTQGVYDLIIFDTQNWFKIKNIMDSKFDYTIRYLCKDAIVLSVKFKRNIQLFVLQLKKLGFNAFEKDNLIFIEQAKR